MQTNRYHAKIVGALISGSLASSTLNKFKDFFPENRHAKDWLIILSTTSTKKVLCLKSVVSNNHFLPEPDKPSQVSPAAAFD